MFDYQKNFPFDPQAFAVNSAGQTFVMAERGKGIVGEKEVSVLEEFRLVSQNQWEVEDGQLVISKNSERVAVFDSLSYQNGSYFFSGYSYPDNKPVMLWNHRPLLEQDPNWGVLIASSFGSYQSSLKRLIYSLKSQLPLSRVTIYISGAPENKTDTFMGCPAVFTIKSAREFTPLIEVAQNPQSFASYLFLLHDTCEVNSGFASLVGNLDVGLNFDVVLAMRGGANTQTFNLGLYRRDFLVKSVVYLNGLYERNLEEIRRNQQQIIRELIWRAKLVCFLGDSADGESVAALGKRDVYGTGEQRQALHFRKCAVVKHTTKNIGARILR